MGSSLIKDATVVCTGPIVSMLADDMWVQADLQVAIKPRVVLGGVVVGDGSAPLRVELLLIYNYASSHHDWKEGTMHTVEVCATRVHVNHTLRHLLPAHELWHYFVVFFYKSFKNNGDGDSETALRVSRVRKKKKTTHTTRTYVRTQLHQRHCSSIAQFLPLQLHLKK